jgi:hypothetical protein
LELRTRLRETFGGILPDGIDRIAYNEHLGGPYAELIRLLRANRSESKEKLLLLVQRAGIPFVYVRVTRDH